jgi:hypothetical protein
MWVHFEKEEYEVIESLLEKSGLEGLKALIKAQFYQQSPTNYKHTRENALQAAKTYFSATDLSMDEYVKWDLEGNAYVMAWQMVPKDFIVENNDCGCSELPHPQGVGLPFS